MKKNKKHQGQIAVLDLFKQEQILTHSQKGIETSEKKPIGEI